jgi:hypothetical protein
MNFRGLVIIATAACSIAASRVAFSDEVLFAVLAGGNEVSDMGQANAGEAPCPDRGGHPWKLPGRRS